MFRICEFSTFKRVALALLTIVGSVDFACADDDRRAAVMLEAPLKLVQATTTLSAPALRFNREGLLHAAWAEKNGIHADIKTVVIPLGQPPISASRVNAEGAGPEAIHQSPGFAIGTDGARIVTWSAANKTPGALFASDLQLTRSTEGQTFLPPVQINDDGKAISHTFEDIVMRVSTDRGHTFDPPRTLSGGSKAEHPTVTIHESGKVAIGWTEHAFPHNNIIVQQGQLSRVAGR
ncbi:MAG: hypothetical protein M3M98_01365 [Nitrospirota bacterium]|nr:hypothetical protein [Nitrospirota bacterium]